MDLAGAWASVMAALNSNFSVALTGGAIGAFGGAVAAQYIAEAVSKKRSVLNELKQTNKAILFASQICNSALALKSQFTKPLADKFAEDKADFEYASRRKLVGGDHLSIGFDFSRFPAPSLPTEPLQKLVYENLSVLGRELSAVAEIMTAYSQLATSMGDRERFIERTFGEHQSQKENVCFYFGLRHENGKTDTTYPDLIGAILDYNDDLAFFSVTLCEDLVEHALRVRAALPKRNKFRKPYPNVSRVDFSGPRKSGLLVTAEKYDRWQAGFTTVTQSDAVPVRPSSATTYESPQAPP